MNDAQLLRYARHILLDEFGIEGQEKLLASTALVVGAGGLGSPAAMYLASAGVGTIILADHDTVEISNLQRQILHQTSRLGALKAESGRDTLLALNPEIAVETRTVRLEGTLLDAQIAQVDVVLDCTDNFATRHAINRACVKHNKPLVSGAAIRFEGQISVFDPRDATAPCYHCLFPEAEDLEAATCASTGVFSPLVGIIGSMQAAEALKVLSHVGQSLKGQLLILDAFEMDWHRVSVKRDPGCPVCATRVAGPSA
ncbi:MAG: molybdopterin biosynthesis protein MoeB [Alcaligenaceae bacterium]|nr:MAG: molybdopterin biosynthesis protein MoeB [Alcaligenaceae bacterium]